MGIVLDYADTYGSLLPLIVMLVHKNKVSKEVFILFGYFIASIIVFGYSNYLADRNKNNYFLYHIFSIIELSFILCYFKIVLRTKLIRFLVTTILLFFYLFSIFNILFLEKINSLNSNTLSIEFFLMIIFCFIYYYKFSKTDKILFFQKEPNFWIVTGFFIYFSSTILIFSFYKYAAKNYKAFTINFWALQEIMYLVKNLVITYGLLCFRKMK